MNVSSSVVVLSGLLFICFDSSWALEECRKVDDCTCETADGKQIYIGTLGLQGSEAPKFGYSLATQPQFWPWEYAYNPCYPFSDGPCKDAVACQRSAKNHSAAVSTGDVNSTWRIDYQWQSYDFYAYVYVIEYEHVEQGFRRVTHVTLNCNLSANEPILERFGDRETGHTYYFNLTSKCACPGTCYRPLPTLPPLPVVSELPTLPSLPVASELSVGSILCIIFVVIVTVYLVSGSLYMKVVRQAHGRQVIPNYEMWSGLHRNAMDGVVFCFNGCKTQQGYDSVTEASDVRQDFK